MNRKKSVRTGTARELMRTIAKYFGDATRWSGGQDCELHFYNGELHLGYIIPPKLAVGFGQVIILNG